MTPLARALSALKRLDTRPNAKAARPKPPSVSNETRQGGTSATEPDSGPDVSTDDWEARSWGVTL